MKNGIIIVATGSPYYGRMAFNLLVTIKAVENFPVAIVIDGDLVLSHLDDGQRELFDHIILDESLENMGAGSKLKAYHHTPFDNTLLIDADNLWFQHRTPSDLFAELKGVDFTAITEGFFEIETRSNHLNVGYPLWADADDIISAYQLKRGKLYQWRSEVIYFTKCKKAQTLFDAALKIYRAPLVKTIAWGSGIPDEFAINVAAAQFDIHPHQFNWQPSYWSNKHRNRMLPVHLIMKDFFIFSTGGNNPSPSVKKIYNNISAVAHRKLKKQFLFLLQSKSHSLPERKKI